MSYREIIRIFEDRRNRMRDLLLDHSDSIELSKQHQIYGCITEIDLFIKTLKLYQEKSMKKESETQLSSLIEDDFPEKDDKEDDTK